MNITYAKYIDENGDLTTAEKASYLNIKIDNGCINMCTLLIQLILITMNAKHRLMLEL